MARHYYGSLLTLILILVYSCENGDQNPQNQLGNNESIQFEQGHTPYLEEYHSETDSTMTLNFSYKGANYSCSYILETDSMVFSDNKINTLVNELKHNPTLATMINPDGSLNFFDTHEEAERFLKNESETTKTRAYDPPFICFMRIKLYEHDKGRKKGGGWMSWTSSKQGQTPDNLYLSDFRNLRFETNPSISLDNMVSSMEIWVERLYGWTVDKKYQRATVTFYELANYQGRSLVFADIYPGRDYSRRDYFSSFNFNDLASSMTVIFH